MAERSIRDLLKSVSEWTSDTENLLRSILYTLAGKPSAEYVIVDDDGRLTLRAVYRLDAKLSEKAKSLLYKFRRSTGQEAQQTSDLLVIVKPASSDMLEAHRLYERLVERTQRTGRLPVIEVCGARPGPCNFCVTLDVCIQMGAEKAKIAELEIGYPV